jgi:branched-subunit amino acid transport protein
MTDAWLTVVVLAATAAAVRAAGPLLVGGRDLPPRLIGVVDLLGPALLTALIMVATFGADRALEINATLGGVVVAGAILLRRRDALLTAIIAAAAVTALLRAL